ncbi:MAG: flagellar biosynthesis protein FlhA [Porticoccaceae bacterium]
MAPQPASSQFSVPNALHILQRGLGAPLLLLVMMAMIVVPLPPIALDLLFSFNIGMALVVILVAVYVIRPLDFSVFPSVLLVTTLLRLALNVASSRVVLLHGHTGTDAAGAVIEAFGEFVIGGNYAVGLVVFAILTIINFVVVTKGATRVAEVSARFTLDAMPGKQMAIDADLNAGLIGQDEARQRREEVRREADFYGAMDGSSKFVRGDAVAGILILFINLLGGLAIGMLQHGLPLSGALHNYSLLTIGDGLVAQIPALLIATAAAIVVTRVSVAEQSMGQQMMGQMFGKPQALITAAAVLGLIGIIPGLPGLPFLTLAAICGIGAWLRQRKAAAPEVVAEEAQAVERAPRERELSWDDVTPVDLIGLEVGYRLIPLVDRSQGGELMGKIKGVRKKLSQELGFLIQPVHIRDNLDLPPSGYRITLLGVPVAEAEVFPERELAIDPGQVYGTLAGTPTRDPAFGLAAVWIDPVLRDQAQSLGYTVVDAGTVVATHLSRVLQLHASELLGHDETQKLLDLLAKSAPKLVENLTPKPLALGQVHRVLQNLLAEQIPIRDLRTIAEALADAAARTQDPEALTAAVRVAMARAIVQQVNGQAAELPVITLEPALEQLLQQAVQSSNRGGAGIEPGLVDQLHTALAEHVRRQESSGQSAVVLVAPTIRSWLARLLRHAIPGLHVLAYGEIPDNKQIRVVSTLGQPAAVG